MHTSRNASSSSAAKGDANPIQIFHNALAGPGIGDAQGAAIDDYPLAIQGLLGGDLGSQPYMDVLNRPGLSVAPPQPQLYTVRKGDTVSGITGGDYARMADIAAANGLRANANGSPLLRTGRLLLIPNTPASDPVARRRLDIQGRGMVAANTQTMAQREAAQTSAQNTYVGEGLSTPNAPPRKAMVQDAAPSFQWTDPLPRLSRPNVPDYYVGGHGNGYFLKDDAGGSRLVFDDRAEKHWQQVWDGTGKAEGYGADGQPGMGSFGSIGYSYPKYVFHTSDSLANVLGALGRAADGLGVGLPGTGPYRSETPGTPAPYDTAYESPELRTDIFYPNHPPVQTIYGSRFAAPVPNIGQLTAEQIASPYFVRIDPLTGKGPMAIDTSGFSKDTTLNGGTRGARKFWKQWAKTYPDTLSKANASRIKNRKSPVVDDIWTQTFPEHNDFIGRTLEHHHLDYGPNAIPLPKAVHRLQPGWDIWHPGHAGYRGGHA